MPDISLSEGQLITADASLRLARTALRMPQGVEVVANAADGGLPVPEGALMHGGPFTSTRMAALVALSVACAAATVHADDGSTGVPMLPLRVAPVGALHVQRAALTLAGRQVRVDLAIGRRGNPPAVTVSWESERVAWMGYGETYPDRHFPELKFQLDGAFAPGVVHDDVRLGANDISELVRAAGFDPFSITETPPFAVPQAGQQPLDPAIAATAHAQLARVGAIETAPEGEFARWTARRRVEVAVPAETRVLQVAYGARPGIEPATRAALTAPATVRRYCVVEAALPKAVAAGGWVIERFSLPAGLDRKPPERATLAISGDKEPRSTHWFACGPGGRSVGVAATSQPGVPVQPDAQGTVHVLRLSPAMAD